MGREGRKERQKWSKEKDYAWSKMENHAALWLYIHHSAWYVGRIFCGYLTLRFFPNRKNSQNIVHVPANNSNNKVICTLFYPGSLSKHTVPTDMTIIAPTIQPVCRPLPSTHQLQWFSRPSQHPRMPTHCSISPSSRHPLLHCTVEWPQPVGPPT